MTTTIKLPVEVDDLLESIIGSGATYTYWWYHKVVCGPVESYSLALWRNEERTKLSYGDINAHILARTIERIIENRLPGWQDVLHGALNDDFDANSADTVLQTAVLGKVVWG